MKVGAVILAAGSGTRLNRGQPSEKPKVLYEINGRPMVAYTLDLLRNLNIEDRVMVVGHGAKQVEEVFSGQSSFALQKERKGTAHAAKIGESELSKEITHLLIIQGDDSAFYRETTLEGFMSEAKNYRLGFTTVRLSDPGSFGRVVRDSQGEIVEIVEKESATAEQMKIKEVNAAAYFVERGWFNNLYQELKPSKVGKGEIIMPDLIGLTIAKKEKVLGFEVPISDWVGVNTPEELETANQLMKQRLGVDD